MFSEKPLVDGLLKSFAEFWDGCDEKMCYIATTIFVKSLLFLYHHLNLFKRNKKMLVIIFLLKFVKCNLFKNVVLSDVILNPLHGCSVLEAAGGDFNNLVNCKP